MDRYVASIARECLESSGIGTLYLGDVPDGFRIPSLYLPPPELDAGASSLGSFKASRAVYAKVFARTRQEAQELAESIVLGIARKRCRIPVYNEDGLESGEVLRMDMPVQRAIEDGVAQVTLRYSVFVPYPGNNAPLVRHYHIKNKAYD